MSAAAVVFDPPSALGVSSKSDPSTGHERAIADEGALVPFSESAMQDAVEIT
jgi:hypothetical protein